MDNVKLLADHLNQVLESNVEIAEDEKTLIVPRDEIIKALKELKEDTDFTFLEDVTAVDYPEHMEVVYHLMSLKDARVLRVKSFIDRENPHIDTAIPLWHSANVMEREAYDLLGVIFDGHPDLKRVLCPDDFEGHPLRKDFIVKDAKRE